MGTVTRTPVHQPPPATVVEELTSAGVSFATAMAMESWKAREVLDLLRHSRKESAPAAARHGSW
jgi:DNA-binding HxlR family transcriptional regulator